jgi:hypothetical protein
MVLGTHGEIKVNNHLQTSVSHIYAAGDVKGGLQFTYISGTRPVASKIASPVKFPCEVSTVVKSPSFFNAFVSTLVYIALEFASMFQSFGTNVTVLEYNKQFMAREDQDASPVKFPCEVSTVVKSPSFFNAFVSTLVIKRTPLSTCTKYRFSFRQYRY